ncbi:thioredoxin-like protein [Baffinella frigidus]|nr:thioredoxin-like protein [Cryptophyta sp. CCMP2293]
MRAALLALLLIVAAAGCSAQEDQADLKAQMQDMLDDEGAEIDESAVMFLDTDNFDAELKKYKFALVEFMAPWCGHCNMLRPKFAAAALQLKDTMPEVAMVVVDATEEAELATAFSIKGFPSFKWFVDGTVDHDTVSNGRETEEIVQWVTRKAGNPTTEITDADGMAKASTDFAAKGINVVGFFNEASGEAYEEFLKAARKDDMNAYFVCFDTAIATKQGVKKPPGVEMYRSASFDTQKETYAGILQAANLVADVKKLAVPPVLEFNQENGDLIFIDEAIPKVFLFHHGEADLKVFGKVARDASVQGKVVMAYVTANSDQELGKFLGASTREEPDPKAGPEVFLFDMHQGSKKYKLDGKMDEKTLKNFINSALQGKVALHVKSAARKEGWDAEPVKEIVASQWEEFVVNSDKHVVVEVYAPWCGHCKKLEPKYTRVAEMLARFQDVVLAKCDGTENDLSEVQIEGFPTVLAYKKGSKGKDPVDLKGVTHTLKP